MFKKIYKKLKLGNPCIFPSGTIPSFCSGEITEWSCFVFSWEEYSIVTLLCLTLKNSLLPLQKGVTTWSRLAHFFVQISKIWNLCILLTSVRHQLVSCFPAVKESKWSCWQSRGGRYRTDTLSCGSSVVKHCERSGWNSDCQNLLKQRSKPLTGWARLLAVVCAGRSLMGLLGFCWRSRARPAVWVWQRWSRQVCPCKSPQAAERFRAGRHRSTEQRYCSSLSSRMDLAFLQQEYQTVQWLFLMRWGWCWEAEEDAFTAGAVLTVRLRSPK